MIKQMAQITMASAVVLTLAGPALAQDAFDSTADKGNLTNNTGNFTGSQTTQGSNTTAPALQGATNGTIGPQGNDATCHPGRQHRRYSTRKQLG